MGRTPPHLAIPTNQQLAVSIARYVPSGYTREHVKLPNTATTNNSATPNSTRVIGGWSVGCESLRALSNPGSDSRRDRPAPFAEVVLTTVGLRLAGGLGEGGWEGSCGSSGRAGALEAAARDTSVDAVAVAAGQVEGGVAERSESGPAGGLSGRGDLGAGMDVAGREGLGGGGCRGHSPLNRICVGASRLPPFTPPPSVLPPPLANLCRRSEVGGLWSSPPASPRPAAGPASTPAPTPLPPLVPPPVPPPVLPPAPSPCRSPARSPILSPAKPSTPPLAPPPLLLPPLPVLPPPPLPVPGSLMVALLKPPYPLVRCVRCQAKVQVTGDGGPPGAG